MEVSEILLNIFAPTKFVQELTNIGSIVLDTRFFLCTLLIDKYVSLPYIARQFGDIYEEAQAALLCTQ